MQVILEVECPPNPSLSGEAYEVFVVEHHMEGYVLRLVFPVLEFLEQPQSEIERGISRGLS